MVIPRWHSYGLGADGLPRCRGGARTRFSWVHPVFPGRRLGSAKPTTRKRGRYHQIASEVTERNGGHRDCCFEGAARPSPGPPCALWQKIRSHLEPHDSRSAPRLARRRKRGRGEICSGGPRRHACQVLSPLERIPTYEGLILNFGAARLVDGIKRVSL